MEINQVKLIEANNVRSLVEQINDFLDNNHDLKCINIQFHDMNTLSGVKKAILFLERRSVDECANQTNIDEWFKKIYGVTPMLTEFDTENK